jgi:thiamine-monophosphate kinase
VTASVDETGARPGGISPEQALIRKAFARLSESVPGAVGLIDDAASLSIPTGFDLVVTKDLVVAGVHFLPQDPPDLVARKALRVNLSDLAAKGARPGAYFLGLALPAEAGEDWVLRFAAGLEQDQREFGCGLGGGDMTRTGGALTVSITATGLVPSGHIVRRHTARPGDLLFVTGTIGDAVLGLGLQNTPAPGWARALSDDDRAFLIDRYRLPQPRVGIAEIVCDLASAAMDVSDGLAGDLALMCAGSGLGARVVADDIPLSVAARAACGADPEVFARLLGGGDDYEILAAVAPAHAEAFVGRVEAAGIAATAIGEFGEFGKEPGAPSFVDRKGRALDIPIQSYSHF